MCVCVCVYPATPQNQLCHLGPNVAIYEMSSPSYVTSDASHAARLLLALKTLRRISWVNCDPVTFTQTNRKNFISPWAFHMASRICDTETCKWLPRKKRLMSLLLLFLLRWTKLQQLVGKVVWLCKMLNYHKHQPPIDPVIIDLPPPPPPHITHPSLYFCFLVSNYDKLN